MSKELILNTSERPYHLSFYDGGRLVTVSLVPGASNVKKEYIPSLQKIRTFQVLEEDGIMVVGVKTAKDPIEAPVISAQPKVDAKKEPVKKPSTKRASTKKASNPPTIGESGVGDLDNF